jgi:hypothetical protein
MMTPEQHAGFVDSLFSKHWKVGTVAAALGVHHDTVRATTCTTRGLRTTAMVASSSVSKVTVLSLR